MTTDGYRTLLSFAADHPSLPGHFPGRPLVAGVLLLEQVAAALRAWRGERLARVLEAKFVAPLEPGQPAELRLTPAGAQVRFEIRRDGTLLARGLVEGATDA
jgi:3-hydroxymyristoyl/3-hydroxydecanoyl-(acyl carrier protein) dehydratase